MRGFIYSIRSKSRPDLVYFGSTVQTLKQRLCGHLSAVKNETTYCTARQIILLGDAYIELEETVEFTTRKELREVEKLYIQGENCVNTSGKKVNIKKVRKISKAQMRFNQIMAQAL